MRNESLKKDKTPKEVRPCEKCGLKVTGQMVKINPWAELTTFAPDEHRCRPDMKPR